MTSKSGTGRIGDDVDGDLGGISLGERILGEILGEALDGVSQECSATYFKTAGCARPRGTRKSFGDGRVR
jgi:hypothetical protein